MDSVSDILRMEQHDNKTDLDTQMSLLTGILSLTLFYFAVTWWCPSIWSQVVLLRERNTIMRTLSTNLPVEKTTADISRIMKREKEEGTKKKGRKAKFKLSAPPITVGNESQNISDEVKDDTVVEEGKKMKETAPIRKPAPKFNLSSARVEKQKESDRLKGDIPKRSGVNIAVRAPVSVPHRQQQIPPNRLYQTQEAIALQRTRDLKKQQDLEYAQSVEENRKKQDLIKKQANFETSLLARKKELQEKSIELTERANRAQYTDSTVVNIAFKCKVAGSSSSSAPSAVDNGTVKLVARFSTADTTATDLMDFIQTAAEELTGDIFCAFDLSLSYPKRTWSRSFTGEGYDIRHQVDQFNELSSAANHHNSTYNRSDSDNDIRDTAEKTSCSDCLSVDDVDEEKRHRPPIEQLGINSDSVVWVHFKGVGGHYVSTPK